MESATDCSFLEESFEATLQDTPRPFRSAREIGTAMHRLTAAGLTDLPMPAAGRTIERWRALASVGALDLSLAKIYEGHTDALAILTELGGIKSEGLWTVWAAEPPNARPIFHDGRITGRKEWCSGAAIMDHALVSAWTKAGDPILAQVSLRQPEIAVESDGWQAVGMGASQSVATVYKEARAEAVGSPGDYVSRPGFWHGGAGIAAVWYGGAVAIASALAASSRVSKDPHVAAHLGAVDSALRGARALLVEAAAWIDANPTADAFPAALRVRANVEAAANEVLLRTGRALGPGPLCRDAAHAQRCADLPVFLRQSHAERDLAALGESVSADSKAWAL